MRRGVGGGRGFWPGGGRPRDWQPSDLGSAVEGWWRAQDFADAGFTDGTAIGSWADKSGKGRTLSQGTAGKRAVLKTGINGINGLAVASFDGVDDEMLSAASLGTFGPSTILAVVRAGTDVTGTRCFFSGITSSQFCFSDTGVYKCNAGTAVNGPAATASKNQYIAMVTGAAGGKIRVNGTEVAVNPGAATASMFALGSSNGGLYWSGLIAEVVYVSRQLTAAELLLWDEYCKQEYGFAFTAVTIMGTSYATEATGSGASTAATSYAAFLRKALNGAATNYAANGGMISQEGAVINGSADYGTAYWMMRNFSAPAVAPYAPPISGIIFADYGLNDLNYGGGQAAVPMDTTVREYITGLTMLGQIGQWEDNHASHAYGAGYPNNAITTRNAGVGDHGGTTLPGGDITFTTPADFPGGDLYCRVIGQDAAAPAKGPVFQVWMGGGPGVGTLHGTLEGRGNVTNGVTRLCRTVYRIPNVAAGGGQTVVLHPTTVDGSFFAYDGMNLLGSTSPLFVIMKAVRLPPGGYAAHGGGTANYGDADINALNVLLDGMPAFFPAARMLLVDFPLMHGDPAYFNADLVHPGGAGDLGHKYRFNRIMETLRANGYRVPGLVL